MPKILIADDHPLFREALHAALVPHIDELSVCESDSLDTTLEMLQEHSDLDIVLLDLQMPGCDNFYGLLRVTEDFPNIPVAVVSANDSLETVSQVMTFGAEGFIPKSSPTKTIAEAITSMIDGKPWLPASYAKALGSIDDEKVGISRKVAELTPKQFQVLKYLQQGKMNKQIAYDMNVTEATVKAHISAIFRKLEVNTRTQAVLLVDKLQLE